MTDDHGKPQPKPWPRIALALLCFAGFSITLPPLGFLMFLTSTGIVDERQMSRLVERINPFGELLMTSSILGFGFLAVFSVFTGNPKTFRVISLILILLAVTSLGGCVMALAGLRDIGS